MINKDVTASTNKCNYYGYHNLEYYEYDDEGLFLYYDTNYMVQVEQDYGIPYDT